MKVAVSRYSGLTPKNREFKIQIMTDSFYDLTTTEILGLPTVF